MKRILDLAFALLGLALLSPVLVLVAIGVALTSEGPVLFRQERLGLGGAKFQILKFRTMTVNQAPDAALVTAGGDARITPFGAFLRRWKLDELPQLFNVLRGEMAFVGPRPEVAEFAELFPREYGRILQVRPGITHPATLSFRREEAILAAASDPRRFYVERLMPRKLEAYEAQLQQSLLGDIWTILATMIPQLAPPPLDALDFRPVLVPGNTHASARVARPVDHDWPVPVLIENIPAFASDEHRVSHRPAAVYAREEIEDANLVGRAALSR